jgi:hypothetical protein
MAEGEGFEPPVPFQAQRFSRPPVSTAHPSLRAADAKCSRSSARAAVWIRAPYRCPAYLLGSFMNLRQAARLIFKDAPS